MDRGELIAGLKLNQIPVGHAVVIDAFTVTENTTFEETEMGDGQFLMLFEMVDLKNESVYSDPIIFTVTDGEIEAEL